MLRMKISESETQNNVIGYKTDFFLNVGLLLVINDFKLNILGEAQNAEKITKSN